MAHNARYRLLHLPSSFHPEHGSSTSLQVPRAALPLKLPKWGFFISEVFKMCSRLLFHLLIVGTMSVVSLANTGKKLSHFQGRDTKPGIFLWTLAVKFASRSAEDQRPPRGATSPLQGLKEGSATRWVPAEHISGQRDLGVATLGRFARANCWSLVGRRLIWTWGVAKCPGLQGGEGQSCAQICGSDMVRGGCTLWLLTSCHCQEQPAWRK